MKVNEVKWPQIIIWATVTFIAVCVVFAIYIYSYELLGSDRLDSLSGETALTIFQGTFGLAAALLIAFVAVVLANSSLEISKRQSVLVEKQARLELETRLLQIQFGAPEIGQQAILASREVLHGVNRLFTAGSRLAKNLKISEDKYEQALFEEEQRSINEGINFQDDLSNEVEVSVCGDDEPWYSGDPLGRRHSVERSILYEEAVSEIKQSVQSLTGFVLRYDNKVERDRAITRHFGGFFDHLLTYTDKMCEAQIDLQNDEVAIDRLKKIEHLAPDSNFRVKLLGYLSEFKHVDLSGYRSKYIAPQEICDNLPMEIAAGRFNSLDDAFNMLSPTIPNMYFYYTEVDRVDFAYISALAAVAIDLSNPFRAVLNVEKELDRIIEGKENESFQIKRAMIESIRRHIINNIPYAYYFFNGKGSEQSSSHAWIKEWRDDSAYAEVTPTRTDIKIYESKQG